METISGPSLRLYAFTWADGRTYNSRLQPASLAGFNRAFRIRRSSRLIHVRCFSTVVSEMNPHAGWDFWQSLSLSDHVLRQ